MSDINDLKNRALGIRNETRTGANTANRVGQLLYDMIGYVDDNEENWESGGQGQGTTLRQPLLSINSLGYNPTSSDRILVYSGGSWHYEQKPTGGGSGGGGDTIYYEQAFCTTDTKTPPTLPTGDIDGINWKRYAENDDATHYVWMATRRVTNGVGDSWVGPWLISGADGEPGADGKGIEFVYTKTVTDTVESTVINSLNAAYGTSTFQQDDYVPNYWTDNPQGITSASPYEWVAIRTSDKEGVWTQFVGPILWAKWGQNGMDGDGVEYIFYASTSAAIPSAFAHPENWSTTDTTIGKDGKKFQDRDYVGPSNSGWTDNPWDLETLGQGARQWVSQRKRNAETGLWEAFTPPVLWSYYGKDGANGVADGYIFDLTKDSAQCYTDQNGDVTGFTVSTGTMLDYNGTAVTNYTVGNGTIRMGGNTYPGTGNPVTVSFDQSTKTVTMELGSFTNVAGNAMIVPITASFGTNQQKTKDFTIYFVEAVTKDNVSLHTNANQIHYNYYRTDCHPQELEVWCLLGDTIIRPTDADTKGYSFQYEFVGTTDSSGRQTLTSNSIPKSQFAPDSWSTVVVYLLYNGAEILYQEIPYTFDGAPGIGITQYSIEAVSSNVVISESTQKVVGTVTFKVLRNVSGEAPQEQSGADLNSADIRLTAQADGQSVTPSYNSQSEVWTFSINADYTGTPYAVIQLLSNNNTLLASLTVPFAKEGPKGSSWTQSLNGVVTRILEWNENGSYYTGEAVDANDGVKYLDIVHYNYNASGHTGDPVYTGGSYYRLKPGQTGSSTGPIQPTSEGAVIPPADENGAVNNDYWIEFASPSDSAAFQALIAEYGYISNLTGRELIITDNGTPVAGITSGHAVTGDGGEGLTDENRGNIRIWAGTPENGNLNTCNFYVTDKGILHAKNGEFSGTVEGISGTFRSLECLDGDGNATGNSIKFGYYGNTYIGSRIWFTGDIRHQADLNYITGRYAQFSSEHIAADNIGTGNTNTIIIRESGFPNVASSIIYCIGSYSYVSSFSVPSNKVYKISLEGSWASGISDSDKQAMNGSWFDTVVIIPATNSGELVYDFTINNTLSNGKKLTVINAASNVEAYIAVHSNKKFTLSSKTALNMTYISPSNIGYSADGPTQGAGWFITSSYRNV